jgi:hypothetical protein
MKIVRLFIDCEFTSPELDANIISIGLVSEDGTNRFYAEFEDTWSVEECSLMVQDEIIPLLDGGEKILPFPILKSKLKQWIESFDSPVQIWVHPNKGTKRDIRFRLYTASLDHASLASY